MESRVNIYHVSDKGNGDFKDNGDRAQSRSAGRVCMRPWGRSPALNVKTLGMIFSLNASFLWRHWGWNPEPHVCQACGLPLSSTPVSLNTKLLSSDSV